MVLAFLGLVDCQVFEELHYVYVLPEIEEAAPTRPLNPNRNTPSLSNTGQQEESPASPYIPDSPAISNPRGDSIRFYAATEARTESGSPLLEIYATIMDATMARNVFRTGRGPREGGRMPDVLFLEMRVNYRGSSPVTYNPYSTRIDCQGKTPGLLPPSKYQEEFASFANQWISYAWHMIPRNPGIFFRPDPGQPSLRDEYLLSQAEKDWIRKQKIEFLNSLRRSMTLKSNEQIVFLLPFERVPIDRDCVLSIPLPGGPKQFHFSRLRMEMDEWKDHRQKLENAKSSAIYLRERQDFLRTVAEQEEKLRKAHTERRNEFCEQVQGKELREPLKFCDESFWFRWWGSGFE